MLKTKLSILDLVIRYESDEAIDAINRTTELAKIVDDLGYSRYWITEHHNFAGVMSSATDIIVQHLLQNTKNIRIGAGGVMLPNHTTLQVAETYGTIETLYPNRLDLGLGRAPGTDSDTARVIYKGNASRSAF